MDRSKYGLEQEQILIPRTIHSLRISIKSGSLVAGVILMLVHILLALCIINIHDDTAASDTKSDFYQNNVLWVKTIGGSQYDGLYQAVEIPDGTFIMSGYTLSSDGDMFIDGEPESDEANRRLGKFQADGMPLWVKNNEHGAIVVGKAGDIYAVNYVEDNDDEGHNVITRYDDEGTVAWQKQMNKEGEIFASVATLNGDYIACGTKSMDYADASATKTEGVTIMRIDSQGKSKWRRSYQELAESDGPRLITESQRGNLIVVGKYFETSTIESDHYIMKVDDKGDVIWHQSFGGFENVSLHDMVTDDDENIIACGSIGTDKDDKGFRTSDFFLAKFDQSGNLLWTKTYGGSRNDTLSSIELSDDGFVVVGYSDSFDGDIAESFGSASDSMTNAIIGVFDKDGNKKWIKAFGGSESDRLLDITKKSDGTYVAAGMTMSNDHDILEPKCYDDGLIVCFKID